MTPEEQIAIAKLSDHDMEKCQLAYAWMLNYNMNDPILTFIWFYTNNNDLGGSKPKDIMINGEIDNLLSYIEKNIGRKYYPF